MVEKKSGGHRGHGEGSISLRKDGRYEIRVTLEDGTRKRVYAKNKKEANEKLRQLQQELHQGTIINGPQQTLEQYLKEWLETHKQTIRPRSWERYEAIVRLHLVPTLGKLPLQKITPQHLDRLYRQKLESGLKPKSVAAIHGMLHTALDKAVRLGLVSRNVCKMVSPPRVVRKEITPLSAEQARKLLEAAKGHPQEVLFILALSTGMRRGELLGLKWKNVDLVSGVLRIRQALVRMPTGQGYQLAETKTAKSRRSLVLTAPAVEALKKHKAVQQQWKEAAGPFWHDNDFVFCKAMGEHLDPGYDVLVQLKMLLKKAGLPEIRFHDLRHSTATLLLEQGTNPKIVQEILGHSQISMTMDIYSHVLPTMQMDAMSKLGDLLEEADEEEEEE
ncbi:tyrosine-type recombinase/integrase [Dictyobacter kobayashii]|uniref:Site-specific integrase n=1 Tax=Dictyobacter kobayashii TaxID=2014872 RepID=A0A402AHQ9_9CHLR|nr:tyrosine-type recombinase/integrase [Dictyobacter kobayashii]GCE18661.1 site-specific integrase [Dictyobacter kobayashii]